MRSTALNQRRIYSFAAGSLSALHYAVVCQSALAGAGDARTEPASLPARLEPLDKARLPPLPPPLRRISETDSRRRRTQHQLRHKSWHYEKLDPRHQTTVRGDNACRLLMPSSATCLRPTAKRVALCHDDDNREGVSPPSPPLPPPPPPYLIASMQRMQQSLKTCGWEEEKNTTPTIWGYFRRRKVFGIG